MKSRLELVSGRYFYTLLDTKTKILLNRLETQIKISEGVSTSVKQS